MQLNYRDSKPIYEQIKEGIRRMIVMNVIKQKHTGNLRRKAIFILKVVKEPLLLMLRQPGRV